MGRKNSGASSSRGSKRGRGSYRGTSKSSTFKRRERDISGRLDYGDVDERPDSAVDVVSDDEQVKNQDSDSNEEDEVTDDDVQIDVPVAMWVRSCWQTPIHYTSHSA